MTAAIAAVLALGAAGCTTSPEAAHLTAGAMARDFQRRLLSGPRSESDVRALIDRTDDAHLVASATNPMRGGTSVLVQFTATRRTGLTESATDSSCLRVDFTGGPVTTADVLVVGYCLDGTDPLAPELPTGSDVRASQALADTPPDARLVARSLHRVLPRQVDVTTHRGRSYEGQEAADLGYRGGPVVTAVATGGFDCLRVWVWRGGSVVWSPPSWETCSTVPAARLLDLGSLPLTGVDAAIVRP